MQAWAACEMGQPDLAYEHFLRSVKADLIMSGEMLMMGYMQLLRVVYGKLSPLVLQV